MPLRLITVGWNSSWREKNSNAAVPRSSMKFLALGIFCFWAKVTVDASLSVAAGFQMHGLLVWMQANECLLRPVADWCAAIRELLT